MKAKRRNEMATIIVIYGVLGPLIVVGIIGLLHELYINKKGKESKT
jgi:hypothetical protein